MHTATQQTDTENITRAEPILAEWKAWQTSQGLSDRTTYERELAIRNLLAFTGEEALEVTSSGIIQYVGRKRLSAATRASYHAHIRAFCKWLVTTDRRADNPALKTPSPKRRKSVPRPLLDNQFTDVLRAADDDDARLMIMLYACAGLREFEIAKLHDDDLNLSRGVMTITGKGGKTAMVPLQDDLWAELRRHRNGKTRGHVFPSPEHTGREHITRSWVYTKIKRAIVAAGVVGTPHQLRHWYGTSLLEAGNDIRVVQELMRHESTATTQIYTRVDMRMRRSGIALLRLPDELSA